KRLAELMTKVPQNFPLHPRVQRVIDDRRKMAAGALELDWGFAESLAYATLLAKNFHVQLAGQASARGTFCHRHAPLFTRPDGGVYLPLAHIADENAVLVADSLLPEGAVLGFEYGYSTTSPDCLVIWGAQFGDFANGAQVVIDQFIS